MGFIGFAVLLCVFLFWKEFKLLSFDPDYGNTLGYSIVMLDVFLTGLLVISIVIGLQTVGVVLMSTMFIAPAAAARQWTSHLGKMVCLAGCIGLACGIVGSMVSSSFERIPTGPTIVVVMSSVVIVSLFFAPHRGLFWQSRMRKTCYLK